MGTMDRFSLDGRVAVVTGGTRGLGEGFAAALAEAGASVMLVGRDEERGSEVKAAISGNGRADKEQVTLMVTRVLGLAAAPKPADAADALALAVSDAAEARRRGEAGRVRAVEEFSWEAIAGRTLEVYRAALAAS